MDGKKNPLTVLSFNKDHFFLDNFHAIYESYKMVYICRERRTQSDFLLVRFPSLACVRIICLVFVPLMIQLSHSHEEPTERHTTCQWGKP